MKQIHKITILALATVLLATGAANPTPIVSAEQAGPKEFEDLRAGFVNPKGSGTTTLWWLNGKLSKAEIREQLLQMRDHDGFGGVAPLTLFRMKPPTEPAYLSDEYFEMYGCILDTAKELGMTVVFYDDCDFPSGTAGNQMAERYPDDLMKYLARGTATVQGPGEAVVPMPTGTVMSVVAKNLDNNERRVVSAEARLAVATSGGIGGSAGFRQPPEEEGRYEYFRVLNADGTVLCEDKFTGTVSGKWLAPGASHVEKDGLHATGCLPMSVKDLKLPAKFIIETRLTIVRTAAALAFGVQDENDLIFWQFNARTQAIRPHIRHGGYRTLSSVSFPFETNRAYDVRLVVDGGSVVTWIDGRRVAEHQVERPPQAAVRWPVPAGRWEVQAFVCATAPAKRFVDYLDPQAMQKFIGLTYDRFAQKFPAHFGTTIRMTFYDDLSTYHVPDCLMWTPTFNEKFRARFGRSAEALYPALWENIGADTAAARASLLGLRNELLAEGYQRAVQAWCDNHNMICSGHPAAAYRANPLQSSGDAILWYKYQGAPLTDYIHYFDHGIDGFKIPASAAYNFDRPTVVCEIYGNFHQQMSNDSNMLYRAGMEIYARGINYLLPHGTWWDPAKMRIVPEISWRNPAYSAELPRYNRWAARCETLLRAGRHAADIGILYPIDDLAARYHVGLLPFTHGKDPIPGSDYYELARLLTGELRRDFTFLHPEIVDTRCRVEGREFVLANTNNWERYRVLILPACRSIRVGNLQKARDFLAAGGRVIATTCLPEQSAEFGHDEEVRRLAREMFGPGGRGVFVPEPNETTLLQALDGLGFAWDVRITHATDIPRNYRKAHDYGGKLTGDPDAYEGGNRAFAYLHRSVPGAEVYFFANASAFDVASDVQLRGKLRLELWDPHTGATRPLDASSETVHDEPVTRFKLSLPALHSIFVVGR
ncbi:MAG: glycosyl hydrolase [Verrucomicrobiota bacterium]